jgi:NADPH-dependent 2,4-dienoyl-CoA reductase/sulfur reductase-like enzyme/pSer/pThr/pTyr-binding forkhead associated (FHA) protein/ferredoxin
VGARFVIVGDGAAGRSAAAAIRRARGDARIVVLSEEAHPFTWRAAITGHLQGLVDEERLTAPPEVAMALGVERRGVHVAGIDPARRVVSLADGEEVPYDALLVATGSRPRRLAIVPGANLPGVVTLRTLADARALAARAAGAANAVVVGAGFLGLEVARGLRVRGVRVTLVHEGPWVLPHVLDRPAGRMVETRLLADGVRLEYPTRVEAFEGAGEVERVRLAGGDAIETPLVVLALGAVPEVGLLSAAGARLEEGRVAVDEHLRVAGLAGVFAAGDVAHPPGETGAPGAAHGFWALAAGQGRVAGSNMARREGEALVPWRPGVFLHQTRAYDLDLAHGGEHVDSDGESVVDDERDGEPPAYRRAVLREGRVAGVLLLGDRARADALKRLMDLPGSAGDAGAIRERLFDRDFDLASWVSRRAARAGTQGGTAPETALAAKRPGPRAPPPSKGTSEIVLDTPPPPEKAHAPLRLSLHGAVHEFLGGTVRLGGDASDVPLDDATARHARLDLVREGVVWVARPEPGAPAWWARNGRLVTRPEALADGDVLGIGLSRLLLSLGGRSRARRARPASAAWVVGPAGRHALDRAVVAIGRRGDNDVVVDEPRVAPLHAQVVKREGGTGFDLVDAGGGGTTLVAGTPLQGARRLAEGDEVQVGGTAFTFRQQTGPDRRGPEEPTGTVRFLYLVGDEGSLAGQAWVVPPGAILGRGAEADLVLDDPLLSRLHLRVEADESLAPTVTDLGSLNGTWVAGRRVAPSVPTPVPESATLRAGGLAFRLTCVPPDAAKIVFASDRPTGESAPTVPAAAPAWRVERWHDASLVTHALSGDEATVGRDPACDVVVAHRGASRRHARLLRGADGWLAEDLGSTHGTSVDGAPLPPGERRPLRDGAEVEIAGDLLFVRRGGPGAGPAAAARFSVVHLPPGARLLRGRLLGEGPWLVGRDARRAAVCVEAPSVSRRHVTLRVEDGRHFVKCLSTTDTRRNGTLLGEGWHRLRDGDLLELQDVALRFEVPSQPGGGVPLSATSGGRDLASLVRDELDACIGCAACLRACPLPEAGEASLGVLHLRTTGLGVPDEAAERFTSACTQCHACVPACPAGIAWSRLVLWQKLGLVVGEADPMPLEASGQMLAGPFTRGDVAERMSASPTLAALSREERLRLANASRLRQVEAGTVLVEEGGAADAVWLLLEGALDVGAATRRHRFRRLGTLRPGQVAPPRAALAGRAADVAVRARVRSLVLGIPPAALEHARPRAPALARALDGLADPAPETLLGTVGVPPLVAAEVASAFDAERYGPGRVVLSRREARDTLAFVSRGVVREWWQRDARVVTSYARTGDRLAFPRRAGDRFLRADAVTAAELLLLRRAAAERLDQNRIGLVAALLAPPAASRG